jgi:ABC-2 type transport system ATP-binding protein
VTVRTEDGGALVSPVAVALDDAGVAVRSLTLRTPTLDDVFLQMTGGHIDASSDEEGSA